MIFVEDLPCNAMGKVQKNLLRESSRDLFVARARIRCARPQYRHRRDPIAEILMRQPLECTVAPSPAMLGGLDCVKERLLRIALSKGTIPQVTIPLRP